MNVPEKELLAIFAREYQRDRQIPRSWPEAFGTLLRVGVIAALWIVGFLVGTMVMVYVGYHMLRLVGLL